MKTALLISTYNWPEALNLIFKSLEIQSVQPSEILIANDGSKEETTRLIEDFEKTSNLKFKHVWHEDTGFRKSAILNKTVAQSTSDYIIQIDGDCIINKYFVKDHIQLAEKKTFLYGSRVNILDEFKNQIFKDQIFEFSQFSKMIKNKSRNLRIQLLRNSYKKNAQYSHKVRGCNISFWRENFIDINGYNEDMEGWGREDSEMILRLLNKGVQGKRLRYGGIVYHIPHPQSSKDNLAENDAIQKYTIENKKTWCENGIEKYLK